MKEMRDVRQSKRSKVQTDSGRENHLVERQDRQGTRQGRRNLGPTKPEPWKSEHKLRRHGKHRPPHAHGHGKVGDVANSQTDTSVICLCKDPEERAHQLSGRGVQKPTCTQDTLNHSRTSLFSLAAIWQHILWRRSWRHNRARFGTEGSTAPNKDGRQATTRQAGPTRRFRYQFQCFFWRRVAVEQSPGTRRCVLLVVPNP